MKMGKIQVFHFPFFSPQQNELQLSWNLALEGITRREGEGRKGEGSLNRQKCLFASLAKG